MTTMRWQKKGLVWCPSGESGWARTHAMGPTPFRISDGVIRVYVTCLDDEGRGRSTYVDVSASDPTNILRVAKKPILDIGEPGYFDDNGVMALSTIRVDENTIYMYYAGFELCKNIRYRIFTGLAVSYDGGENFVRYKTSPILDRCGEEAFFRCGPFALHDEDTVKLWYVAGSSWIEINGKQAPIYDLRYQESSDGLSFKSEGTLSIALTNEDEHGFGRPWVVKISPNKYQLFYSIRRKSLSAYRLGYAESNDGISWIRKDNEMGLDVTPGSFDSDAIMYSAVINVDGKTYCFYNGNNFGEHGFAVAELIA